MTPNQALNLLYNSVRSMNLSAEGHEQLKTAATIVVNALGKLEELEAALSARVPETQESLPSTNPVVVKSGRRKKTA